MILDLAGKNSHHCSTDVLVIGGGTIGLVVATELAARGLTVTCIESGDHHQRDDTHPFNEVEQTGAVFYTGSKHGRFRCLGGTSTRWGGALIPFQSADMSEKHWPITWADLAPFVPDLERIFDLPSDSYDAPGIWPDNEYLARLAKWPAFARRNTYFLLRKKIETTPHLDVWINATATHFKVKDGTLTETTAQAQDGSRLTVVAREVVFAAGALESTRLLHLLGQQNPGALTGKHLGEGFHDHLSAHVADITAYDRNRLNQLVGFRFGPRGSMRNLRFEMSPTSRLRQSEPPFFAHVSFTETGGGFSALRDIFRAVQRRRPPSPVLLLKLMASLPWLVKAVWWRMVRKRLLYPAAAGLQLHLVLEQASRPQNRVDLSEIATDAFGLPLGRITWEVSEEDIAGMERAVDAFTKAWNSGEMSQIGQLRRRSEREIAQSMQTGGGIYHPGGSTRMARSPETGPLGKDLRPFGILNLAVCSTSVLPTGGGANPTMMALLLALRHVEFLSQRSDRTARNEARVPATVAGRK